MSTSPERKIGLKYSAIAHAVALILIIFGLPALWDNRKEPEPMAITVDIVPLGPVSNIKPSAPKPEEKKEDPKEKAEAKNEKPTPVKHEEAKPKPSEPLEKILNEKPTPKPEEKEKPKEKEKKVEDELDAILKSVEKTAKEKSTASSSEEKSDTKAKSDTYDPSQPLSLSEVDAIRSQFIKCWSVPAGAVSAENLVVVLKVQVNLDGSVSEAKLASDTSRYNSDAYFRAAADSAIRAVYKCSPLKNLPADRYSRWKDMKLTFDPKEMLF